jgi:hypothetical protein
MPLKHTVREDYICRYGKKKRKILVTRRITMNEPAKEQTLLDTKPKS